MLIFSYMGTSTNRIVEFGPKSFKEDDGYNVPANGSRYRSMITAFLFEIDCHVVLTGWNILNVNHKQIERWFWSANNIKL